MYFTVLGKRRGEGGCCCPFSSSFPQSILGGCVGKNHLARFSTKLNEISSNIPFHKMCEVKKSSFFWAFGESANQLLTCTLGVHTEQGCVGVGMTLQWKKEGRGGGGKKNVSPMPPPPPLLPFSMPRLLPPSFLLPPHTMLLLFFGGKVEEGKKRFHKKKELLAEQKAMYVR